jgi:uncharacterized membrane protein YfcA
VRALLASPLGLLIGLSLGALGGGGSILAVPALVYAAGQSPRQATATSLILVAITSVIGVLPHWKAGRVRWAAGVVFSAAGVGGSLLGSHWNEAVDPDALLLGFSAVMFVAAWAMWRRLRRAPGGSTSGRTAVRLDVATAVKVAGAGTAVGLMTGFFGVGGGFVIVPALVLALGFTMPEAAATSLVVITINSLVALSTRLQGGNIAWGTVVPFTVASLIGVVLGGRLAGRGNPALLQRWFVGLLVAVATYTAVKSGMALAG